MDAAALSVFQQFALLLLIAAALGLVAGRHDRASSLYVAIAASTDIILSSEELYP